MKEDVRGVRFDEVRTENEDYFEAVLLKKDLEGLLARLDKAFESPHGAGNRRTLLSKEAGRAIEDLGGMRGGQTLYVWQEGSRPILAMLWPWQDGQRVTLKIAQC